jgi:hypothetical protein
MDLGLHEPEEIFTVVYSDCKHADDQGVGTQVAANTKAARLQVHALVDQENLARMRLQGARP